jgi:hypothetical protein
MTFIQTIKQAFTQPTPPAETTSAESSQFISSRQEFEFFKQAFKEKARNKQITAEDILLYNIIRGKDLDRGFTPVTNPTKLANGEDAYSGMRRLVESKRNLRWTLESFSRGSAPGASAIQYGLTREICTKIVTLLKGA